jgi:hypothetical protein
MLRGVMTGAVMCLTTLLAGASALGAAVTLKPGLEKDRQTQYDYTQTIEVEQIATVPDGEVVTEKHSLETKAQFIVKITTVNPDGTAEGTVRVRSIMARQANPDGPMTVAFDFTKGDPKGGEGMAALEAAIAATTFTFDVDASGEVLAVRGIERVQETIGGAGPLPQTLRTFFDPAAMGQTLSTLFRAEGGIGERELGATWSGTKRVPFGPAGALELTTTNALQIADASMAAIAGVTQISLFVPREPAEGVARVELGDANGQALTQWDPTRGGLISHVNTQNIATTWTIADRKVAQTQTSKTEIKRSGD